MVKEKHIKMLLIKLSEKYKVSLITLMNAKGGRIYTSYKLIIKEEIVSVQTVEGKKVEVTRNKLLMTKELSTKAELAGELMRWANRIKR